MLAPTGDYGTEAMLEIIAQESPARPAAVLCSGSSSANVPTVLLTQRAEHLNEHAGQISFPGGKIDPTDASPLDAALREADEEDRPQADPSSSPIGYLADLYATGFPLPDPAGRWRGFGRALN